MNSYRYGYGTCTAICMGVDMGLCIDTGLYVDKDICVDKDMCIYKCLCIDMDVDMCIDRVHI